MGRKFGFSFSAKRALGISSLKGSIARATGIPTTRSGLYRKIGRAVTGGILSSGGGRQSKSNRKTFGVSFSLNRALGISGAKNSLARAIGVPTTGAGLERKIGRMVVGGITGGTTSSRTRPTTVPSSVPAPATALQPLPVETGILCSICSLALLEDEVICPRCAAPAPGIDQQTELRMVWIDLDALRPIERAIMNILGEQLTDTQLAKRLTEAGLPIEEHPLVALVRHWGDFSCTHSTHNTQDKRENCLDRQAGKIALHTLRHYLATLVGLAGYAQQPSPVRYAAWLCDDETENCPLCRQREGVAILVTTRRLPIIDPYCDCNLHIMTPGQEDAFLASIVRVWLSTDPERAQTLQRNAYRSGFLRRAMTQANAGGCCGCGMAILTLCAGLVISALMSVCTWLFF